MPDELRVDRLRVLLFVRFMLPWPFPWPFGDVVSILSIVVRSVVRVRLPFCIVPFCIDRSDCVGEEPLRIVPFCIVPVCEVAPVAGFCPVLPWVL